MSLIITTVPAFAIEPSNDAVFVAINGRDTWSGHLAAENAAGTDGPLASLAAAATALRHKPGPRKIIVRQGRYYLHEPLRLGPDDSGVQFSTFPGEHPVLYGGAPMVGWQRAGDDWVAPLPLPFAKSAGLPMLIKTDAMLPISRAPDSEQGEDQEGSWLFADNPPADIDAHHSFRVRASDQAILSSLPQDSWVNVFGQRGWQNYVFPIKQVDVTRRVITLDGNAWDAIGEGSRFALLNANLSRKPSSWRYDAATNTVHSRRQADVIAATLPCIASIDGGRDIAFTGFGMMGSSTSGAAFCLSRTQNIMLDHLDISNVGEGVRMDRAVETHITNSMMSHIAASAVNLRHGSDHTVVSGNWLHDIGWLQADANAIAFDGSSHNRFTQNHIENVSKFAIGGGSLTEGGAYDNVIEGNEIDHANLRTSDGGGILVIGWSQDATGDVVRGNFISATSSLGNVGWDNKPHVTFQNPITRLVSQAIYLDDWASDVQVSGNLLCGNIGGIELHAGWNNHIFDNFLIGNKGIAIDIDSVEWLGEGAHPHAMEHNVIEHNLVMLTEPSAGQTGVLAVRGGPDAAHFDHNVYAGPGLNASSFHHAADHFWSSYSFGIDSWRHSGQDGNSDAGEDAASVAVRDGFVRVDGSHLGPLPLADIGRPEDRPGLADRIRQKCDLK